MLRKFWRMGPRALSLGILFGLATTVMAGDVPRMSIEDLKSKLGNPHVLILDVRSEADWNASKSKIQGAVRESASGTKTWANKYAQDKTLVLYCA